MKWAVKKNGRGEREKEREREHNNMRVYCYMQEKEKTQESIKTILEEVAATASAALINSSKDRKE